LLKEGEPIFHFNKKGILMKKYIKELSIAAVVVSMISIYAYNRDPQSQYVNDSREYNDRDYTKDQRVYNNRGPVRETGRFAGNAVKDTGEFTGGVVKNTGEFAGGVVKDTGGFIGGIFGIGNKDRDKNPHNRTRIKDERNMQHKRASSNDSQHYDNRYNNNNDSQE
jgi:hypothetical protein